LEHVHNTRTLRDRLQRLNGGSIDKLFEEHGCTSDDRCHDAMKRHTSAILARIDGSPIGPLL
jgi:hypothetical protein